MWPELIINPSKGKFGNTQQITQKDTEIHKAMRNTTLEKSSPQLTDFKKSHAEKSSKGCCCNGKGKKCKKR